MIGYTAGLRRRRGRPSREHQESKAMVSAGAVSCALPSPIGPVAGSRAAPHPNQPELSKIAERTQDAQQASAPGCASEPTAARSKRTLSHTARPVQRVALPWRGHGFLRSHGPREQKVNGEWLTSRYRRPKIGRIRNGALRTNQGPSQNLNEPELTEIAKRTRETAAAERTRRGQQAFKPVRANEPEPWVHSERTQGSGESERTQASPKLFGK